MEQTLPRYPLLKIMLGNATLLSLIYFTIAVVVEVIRRVYGYGWSQTLSATFELMPARALSLAGLIAPLGDALMTGKMSEVGIRVVLGLTAVGIIFAMALGVTLGMWLVRALWDRVTRLPSPPG